MLRISKSLKEHSTLGMSTRKEERLLMECNFGQTIRSTKVNGLTTKRMAKASSGAQMVIRTKAIGRMIKLTVSEPSSQTMERKDM